MTVELEDIGAGLRYAVHVELANLLPTPIAICTGPELHARLVDARGHDLAGSALPSDGPVFDPQWAVIPRDAYLGLRVDAQSVGVPGRQSHTVLLAVGDRNWALAAGAYVLAVTANARRRAGAPCEQWTGELRMPPLDLRIAATTFDVG